MLNCRRLFARTSRFSAILLTVLRHAVTQWRPTKKKKKKIEERGTERGRVEKKGRRTALSELRMNEIFVHVWNNGDRPRRRPV